MLSLTEKAQQYLLYKMLWAVKTTTEDYIISLELRSTLHD